jgi:hypothetical protein
MAEQLNKLPSEAHRSCSKSLPPNICWSTRAGATLNVDRRIGACVHNHTVANDEDCTSTSQLLTRTHALNCVCKLACANWVQRIHGFNWLVEDQLKAAVGKALACGHACVWRAALCLDMTSS